MFGKGLRIFKLFGFEVRIDASWLILAVLIILSLSSGYFPFHYKDLSTRAYAIMGVVGAIGLFASIIIHEMCHSLVGRRYGVPMHGITLFMFGGVAQMDQESKTPKAEFVMAIAGPIASFILAGAFYLLYLGLKPMAPTTIAGVIRYLAWINVILAIFNLIPAFPLDGGRILRAGLWAGKGNLRWATRIAARIGAGFGIVLIVLGIMALLGGSLVGGLWWCLLGMFLRGISHASYQQLLVRDTLSGESVERFIRKDPVTVPSNLSLADLLENYIYEYHYKMFPVVDDGELRGAVSTRQVKDVPREKWERTTVGEVAEKPSESNSIKADTDASQALEQIKKTGNSRLLVVDGGKLEGIVTLRDMIDFLALKLDIEDNDSQARNLQEKLRQAG